MEHMKSNEMERVKYNAVTPTGIRLLGLWGPLLQWGGWGAVFPASSPNTEGGIDYVVIHCPPYWNVKCYILSPASNAVFGVFQARTSRVGTLTYSHIMQTLILLIEWYCMNTDVDGLKIGLLCTYPELWGGQEAGKCNLIVVVLSFNGVP